MPSCKAQGPLDSAQSATWGEIITLALYHPLRFLYEAMQALLDLVFSPDPPPPRARLPLGRYRIAVIGAGLTGVSAATHCVGHGFECTLFEEGGEEAIGGIWSVRVPSSEDRGRAGRGWS